MVPNASDLARRRLTVVGVVRVLSILVWTLATVPIIVAIAFAITEDVPAEAIAVAFVFGAGGGVVGLILWATAPGLSSLVLPTPRAHACPRCRYDLRSITEPRCPECGTLLTEEFLPGHVAPGPSASPPARALGAQITTLLLGRLLAIIAALGFLAGALGSLVDMLFPPTWAEEDIVLWDGVWMIYCIFGFALSLVPLVMPRRFLLWAVPVRLLERLAECDAPSPAHH